MIFDAYTLTLAPVAAASAAATFYGNVYVGFYGMFYACARGVYHACDVAGEDCALGWAYDYGLLRYLAAYATRALALAIAVRLLFRKSATMYVASSVGQLLIAVVTASQSHGYHHEADYMMAGMFVGLLWIGLAFDFVPGFNVPWLVVAAGLAIAGLFLSSMANGTMGRSMPLMAAYNVFLALTISVIQLGIKKK